MGNSGLRYRSLKVVCLVTIFLKNIIEWFIINCHLYLNDKTMNSKKSIRSKSDILKFFNDASVPKKELLIGLEVE